MSEVAAPEWISGLADDALKSDPSIQSFKSVDDLAKSFIETKSLVGKKGLILPGETDPPEAWDPVYNKLGRPEKPEGYKYTPPTGAKVDEKFLNEFKAQAHSMGMTQKQFEKLVGMRVEFEAKEQASAAEALTKYKQDGETALRKEWGAKFEEKMGTIAKMLKSFGGDLPQDPKEYDTRIQKLLGTLAEHLSEDTIGNLGITKGGVLTPEEATAKIAAIRADMKHPYNVANHPDHLKALKEVDDLYTMARPELKQI